jgi:hypothetical protein
LIGAANTAVLYIRTRMEDLNNMFARREIENVEIMDKKMISR